MKSSAAIFCLAFLLQGCAASPSTPVRSAPITPSAGVNAKDETALYLDVVDGLVRQKRFGAAVAFLDGYAAKRQIFEPRYWFLRGNALLGLSRLDEALKAYAALDGTALAAEGQSGKGQVAAARRDWQAAAANFKEAVQGEPANADFLNNLAFAELHLGERAASAAYLRQAWELKPGSSLIRNNLLIALTLNGDQVGADTILKGVKSPDERNQLGALIDSAIKAGDLTKDGT